ncbi:hypothetical protein ABR738_24775 [Streptomyces sp. Edi4]
MLAQFPAPLAGLVLARTGDLSLPAAPLAGAVLACMGIPSLSGD